MDATTLQSRIYAGYAQAAKRLGLTYAQYRPASAANPLAVQQGTLLAALNAEDMTYGKPNRYGNPVWYGLFDGRLTQAGDYLVGPGGTFFIASQQLHLPIQCVECNRTVSFFRPQQQVLDGENPYGGTTDENQTPLMVGWPASVLQGTKGDKDGAVLPGDVRMPWWSILLPAFPGVLLKSADIITDDIDRRYVISSAELTDLGWRLTAMQALT